MDIRESIRIAFIFGYKTQEEFIKYIELIIEDEVKERLKNKGE